MQIILVVLGTGVLALTITDVLMTTIAPGAGGGPVTGPATQGLWNLNRRLARSPHGRILRASGPLAVALIVTLWLIGLWLGWTLIFSASSGAVVSSPGDVPADTWSRIYFTGFTVFTLGVGDLVPVGSPWQVATVLAAASGLVVTTLAITYILPVVTAVAERRQQASRIAALGHDAQEIVVNAWDGTGFDILEQILPDLAADLALTAERQLTYPILGQFHSASMTEDHRVQLTALDEAITLFHHAVDHSRVDIHPLLLRVVRHAAVQHIDRAELPQLGDEATTPPVLDLAPLREAGIPTVDDATFDHTVAEDEEHRRHLVALAEQTPSDWQRATRRRGEG